MPQRQEPSLPTIARSLRIAPQAVFLRTVSRPTLWTEALERNDPHGGLAYFTEDDDSDVSLWRVENDEELIFVTIAINEGRSSLHEIIDFLTVLPSELTQARIEPREEPGITSCEPAKSLHFDVAVDDQTLTELLRILILARRPLGRCAKSDMRKVEEMAKQYGCFAAIETS